MIWSGLPISQSICSSLFICEDSSRDTLECLLELLIKAPHPTWLPCPLHLHSPNQFSETFTATGAEIQQMSENKVQYRGFWVSYLGFWNSYNKQNLKSQYLWVVSDRFLAFKRLSKNRFISINKPWLEKRTHEKPILHSYIGFAEQQGERMSKQESYNS